jgi:hypothetical protein
VAGDWSINSWHLIVPDDDGGWPVKVECWDGRVREHEHKCAVECSESSASGSL